MSLKEETMQIEEKKRHRENPEPCGGRAWR
jgi:hypothetical protein